MSKPSKLHYSQYGKMPLMGNRVFNVIFDYEGTAYERAHANGKPIDLRWTDGSNVEFPYSKYFKRNKKNE